MRTPERRSRLLALLAAAAAALTTTSIASAGFAASQSGGPMTVASASLATPTGLGVTCSNSIAQLRWTQTTSTYADGYDVLRGTTSGGPYPTTLHVVGRGSVTYNDSTINGTSRYYYVVRATKSNWRSGSSNQVTVDSSSC